MAVMPGVIDTDASRYVPPPKADPAIIALKIIEAIEADIEELYPDDMAQLFERGSKSSREAGCGFGILTDGNASGRAR